MRPRMCGDLIGPGGVSRPGEVRRGQAVSRSGGQEVGRSGGREVRRSAGQEVRRSGGQPVSRSAGQPVRFSPWGFSVLFGQGV